MMVLVWGWSAVRVVGAGASMLKEGLAGSLSCRTCHEGFFERWSTSWHGQSLRPFTESLAERLSAFEVNEVRVGKRVYRVELGAGTGNVLEEGVEGIERHRIEQVLGGKNVYFFLTELARGRQQVLPLAFDARREEWYHPPSEALRHIEGVEETLIDWRSGAYTFNASCYGCHVSQGAHGFDEKGEIRSSWAEPGINCETCHGPAAEHVRVFEAAGREAPEDTRLISTRGFDAEQMNSLCAPCHAKQRPLTGGFRPGDRFFDHFELAALEDLDFYADGRDRGENYTYTAWRQNPCAQRGGLDCMHCHTSSGRDKFPGARANEACLPCHQERVENVTAHTRHGVESGGSRCVACHMPRTEFGRMVRHDHSMRPPTPAVTVRFGSPNACTLCHSDQDAGWADRHVREWYPRDYQDSILVRAGLIEAARRQDWSRTDEMAAYVREATRDEIAATSLIRLLGNSDDARKWPALQDALGDASPLVRAAAVQGLYGHEGPGVAKALQGALDDDFRNVRIQAAASMARWSAGSLSAAVRVALERASGEFIAAMELRGDDAAALHELGHFHLDRGDLARAAESFERVLILQPGNVATLISLATVRYRQGDVVEAEGRLRRAGDLAPDNAIVRSNLAWLLEVTGRAAEAEAEAPH
jgi:hypothetical protein